MGAGVSGLISVGAIALASIFGTAASAASPGPHTPAAQPGQGISLGAGGRERSPLAEAPGLLAAAPSSLELVPGGELGLVPGGELGLVRGELGLVPNGRVRPLATTPVISTTPSTTKPYWACPHEACEAIIDPPPLRASGRYELPQGETGETPGPLLEGGGERGGYDPQDLQSAYRIPTSGGEDQTIALVDAFGYEAAEADLNKYRLRYGLGECTRANGCFRKVNQAGEEANYPPRQRGWEAESALDIEMASAACPHCHILLVEASTSLFEAVETAARLGATEVSNSYGFPEWECATEEFREGLKPEYCLRYSHYYDHPGVLVTASTGDSGYDDWATGESFQAPEFPATSPHVTAVGGTALRRAANARGWSEEAWQLGGSGCSLSEPKPSWQLDRGCAHRMTSDVAAVAACETPVSVYVGSFGGWRDVCGTSVSAPLVAGIEAHAGEYARSLPGGAAFYLDPGALFDVAGGRNGECTPPAGDEYFCYAEVSFDGPTGNGTPDGPLGLSSGPPSVTTSAASTVTGSSASLNGTVEPNGLETTYRFEYGTSASYGTTVPVPAAPAGQGKLPVHVSEAIAGLKPNTTYHYRLLATNSGGTSDGADSSFLTAPPTVKGVSPSSGPTIGGTSVTISGAGFDGATEVHFGASQARSFTVRSSTTITAVSPRALVAGAIDVTVSTGAGTSATGGTDQYLYTLGPKLTPSDESGKGHFGFTVALSADGETALVGGPSDSEGRGAAWIFTRFGSTWTQRGAKLTPSDESGKGLFGFSVALSPDGKTALVGGPNDSECGAAWIFTRSGSRWTQRGAKLTPSDESGCSSFGWSVALSPHGQTALIGGPGDNASPVFFCGCAKGAAWIFTRSGSRWTQRGAKLTPSDESGDGLFGLSVALSANGKTALVGGPYDGTPATAELVREFGNGATWAFTRSGSKWAQEGAKLTPSDESPVKTETLSVAESFGAFEALSANGDAAVIGGPGDRGGQGAAWSFTRSGAAWTQQGAKFAPKGETELFEFFGARIALSGDGSTALIGSVGLLDSAARVFTRSGSEWAQQGGSLTSTDESIGANFGMGVALSANGDTALIGGSRDRGTESGETGATPPWGGQGAAWVFTRSGSTWAE
jgi:IPT/TIG domain/FG-GAP repeat